MLLEEILALEEKIVTLSYAQDKASEEKVRLRKCERKLLG